MLRLKIIACKVLYRELSYLTATCENYVDITYIKQGLHDTPQILTEILKEEIRKIDEGDDIHSTKPEYGVDFDAIILAYGLCSNGIVGLSSKKYPIVVPKVDDCISLFLGSHDEYLKQHEKNHGTYWYTPSWIENSSMPSEQSSKARYKEYVKLYGKENADYLLESMLSIKNYSRAGYIEWDELKFPKYEEYTRKAAEFYGWEFETPPLLPLFPFQRPPPPIARNAPPEDGRPSPVQFAICRLAPHRNRAAGPHRNPRPHRESPHHDPSVRQAPCHGERRAPS